MCKIQAFGLLVVTLLLFSQESSGTTDNRIHILSTAIGDVKTLKGSIIIKQNALNYRLPQDFPENCSLNALACFVDSLGRIQNSLKSHTQRKSNQLVGDITTNIQAYLERTLHREVKPKELCNQCDFPRVLKKVDVVLDDLLNLLQRVNAEL